MSFDPNDGISSVSKSFTGGWKAKPITQMTGVQRGAVKSRIKIDRANRIAAQQAKRTFNNRGDLIRLDVSNRDSRTMGYSNGAVLRHLKRNGVSVARTVPSGHGRRPSAVEAAQTRPGTAKEIVYDRERRAKEKMYPRYRSAYRTPLGRDEPASEPSYKVRKSYVPGKGFIPASAIPKAELRALAHGGRKAGQRIVRAKAKADNDTFKSTHADLKKLAEELQTKGKTSRTPSGALHHSVSSLDISTYSPGSQAFAFKTGGRRAPGYLVTAPGASGHIMAHEAAHLMPKRSAYRTHHQLVEDGAKSMREEARADMASGDKSGYYANREAKRTKSGYVEAANSEYARSAQYRHSDEHRAKMFTEESMNAFRDTQDRIHANRGPNYKFKGNQYVDEAGNKKARNHQLLVNGATAAGVAGLYGAGATIAYRRHKAKKEALAKNFTPWDGITSEVSKMGPDQSELHVVGNSGQKKKLRKIPPSDIRRVQ